AVPRRELIFGRVFTTVGPVSGKWFCSREPFAARARPGLIRWTGGRLPQTIAIEYAQLQNHAANRRAGEPASDVLRLSVLQYDRAAVGGAAAGTKKRNTGRGYRPVERVCGFCNAGCSVRTHSVFKECRTSLNV